MNIHSEWHLLFPSFTGGSTINRPQPHGQPEQEEATPEPVAKRRRTGPRDKVAQEMAAEAARLDSTAKDLEQRATEAKADAEEAQQHALKLASGAAELQAAAVEARKSAQLAKDKAKRAQLETTQVSLFVARYHFCARKLKVCYNLLSLLHGSQGASRARSNA